MKNWSIILFFLIIFPDSIFGQLAEKGVPLFNVQKKDIPIVILPEVNVKKLEKEDKINAKSRLKPFRFAQVIELDLDPEEDGIWEIDSDGNKIWYIKLKSAGAYSLSLVFDHYRLPIGSKLFVYSSDQKHIRGSFTYKNNKWNNVLPIAPVMGDEIVIEYYEPRDVEFKGELHISSVAHDYKNVFDYLSKDSKGFGDSGDCNININCEDNKLWQLVKHSVCKITFNGFLCTGALINNTLEEGYPYLLTANHCINNAYDASVAKFYFNYESVDCEISNLPVDQTVSGSKIIATPPEETIDFSLLELLENPPSSYEPYYAGWNRDLVDPTNVISIHHPKGDVKKITKSFSGATTGDYGDGYNENTHWWVKQWDEGTTEKGSSGSPLFDQTGKIIGDLTGGDASCTYNYNDYYQQFYHSWQDFSPFNYQLQHWLDPTHSELVSLSGYKPYDTIPSNLIASLVDTTVYLSWNEVIHEGKIEFYYIYRNSVKIDSVNVTHYSDTLALKNTLYKYVVTAKYFYPFEYESLPSNTVFINTLSPLKAPFAETFEDQTFIPDNWYEERSNDTVGWVFKSGGFEGINDSAFEGYVNAYFYSFQGETSKLILPKLDLSEYAHANLSFYLLMPEFYNDVHNLRILYKKSDSSKWENIRTFNVGVDNWEKKVVSLPDLSADYQIAFEGVGLRGLGVCIDSVSVKQDSHFIDPNFIVNKDSLCISDSIEISTILDDSYQFYWDFGKSAVPSDTSGKGPFWVKYRSPGIKSVQLIVNDTYIKQDNDVVLVYDVPVIPSFTNIGNELISTAENGNQWYLEGTPIIGATNKTYLLEEDGNYFVEVTNSFGCSSVSESKYMVLNAIEKFEEDLNNNRGIKIYPNPSNGNFIVQIESVNSYNFLNYKIIDIAGRIIQSGRIDSFVENKNIEMINPSEGIFFIQIYSVDYFSTSKLLIKK